MRKWLFLLFLPAAAFAVNDPLDSSFLPTVDKVAADYSTAFGTITVSDSLSKVFLSSQTDATNAHWYVGYQMKNEFQSIQVQIGPTTNVTSVNVSMSNLVSTQPVAYTIVASTPDITIYKEYYLNISTPSCLSTSTFMGGARDYMPDPLIPKVDPYWQQTTDAFPLTILSTQTQTVWIDVHIPTAAPSGYYSGDIYVSSGGVNISTFPVVIGVWNWLMPSTATLITQGASVNLKGMENISYGGSDTAVVNYPNTRGSANNANTQTSIDAATQFLDNRWSTYGMDNYFAGDLPASGWSNFMMDYAPLLNGTPTHASSSHPISTILPGAQMNDFRLNILNQASATSFNSATFSQWVSTFTNQGWINKLAYKLSDEPSASIWGSVVASGTLTRTFSTPIVPNVVTTDISSMLAYSSGPYIVDWYMPLVSVLDAPTGDTRSSYNPYLALSSGTARAIGTYEDCVQGGTCGNGTIGPANNRPYPNRMIDGTPVANRALENFIFIDSMTLELYFELDFCEVHQNVGGTEGCTTNSPWDSVYAFGNNGDGTLIYASTGMVVTVSTPIWCPSMRLKYFRDGEQDFEYETYLSSHGLNAFARSEVNTWMLSSHNFSNDPAGIRAARIAMGNEIHQINISSGPNLTSATSASGTVGTAFSYQITTDTNVVTSYGATGLPTSLNINTGTGLVSGTPTVAGVFVSSMSATNSAGTGFLTVTITIGSPPPPPPPPSSGVSAQFQGAINLKGSLTVQ